MPGHPQDEDIVISGISGRYPESMNVDEFWDNLLAGKELNSIDDRRMPVGLHDLPKRTGKVPEAEKFDASFFNISDHQANFMDPQVRIFHETTFEAIVDAGYDPRHFKGSRTGVYIGWCYSDADSALKEDESKIADYLQLASNRVSMTFGFKGISIGVDTACASSFTAFHQAFVALRAGEVDTAIVGGWAIHARPSLAVCFHQLGMISTDGRSKCMDAAADGYCRSEAIVSVVLQRRSAARRIYATVLNARTNTDGFKVEGITFPRMTAQRDLMTETYGEIGLDPNTVDYIEAHMTGTAAGDPVESAAIAEVLSSNRSEPLLVGCLKSNMGHSEGASGLCAITKSCLMFQRKEIPPNLHLNTVNPNISGLTSGQLAPVTSRMPFSGRTIALNCFGFGGCNVHAVISAPYKEISPDSFRLTSTSTGSEESLSSSLPRLVNITSRTREGIDVVKKFLTDGQSYRKINHEFLALLDQVCHFEPEIGFHFRSFILLDEERKVVYSLDPPKVLRERRPLYLFFPTFDVGQDVVKLPGYLLTMNGIPQIVNRMNVVLDSFNMKRMEVLSFGKMDPAYRLSEKFLSHVSSQLLLVSILGRLGITAEGYAGSEVGEVVAAFAARCLSLEEALEVFCHLAAHFVTTKTTSQPIRNGCHVNGKVTTKNGIDYNNNDTTWTDGSGVDSLTLSRNSVTFLERKFAQILGSGKRVKPSNLLSCIEACQQINSKYLISLLTKPTPSLDQLFDFVPKNSITLEVSSKPMLERLLTKGLGPDISYVHSVGEDAVEFLKILGNLYSQGIHLTAPNIYQDVSFPVPVETPSISPLIRWNHDRNWLFTKVPDYFDYVKSNSSFVIDLMEPRYQYLAGHAVDGRILFPATGYLWLVWDIYAHVLGFKGEAGKAFLKVGAEFRDIHFHRATILPKSGPITVNILISTSTGKFSVTEGGTSCVTGFINICRNNESTRLLEEEVISMSGDQNDDAIILMSQDIYKELRVRGYDYGPTFQGLVEAAADGSFGKVKWMGNWVSFTDSLLQLAIVSNQKRDLFLPTFIEYLKCDIKTLLAQVDEAGSVIDVKFDRLANTGCCRGLFLKGLKASSVPRRTIQQPLVESYDFVPYDDFIQVEEKVVEKVTCYAGECTILTKYLTDGESTIKDDDSCEDGDLIHVLKRIIRDRQNMSGEEVKESLLKVREDIPLLSSLRDEKMTRHQVDVVMENILSNKTRSMNILEVNLYHSLGSGRFRHFDLLERLFASNPSTSLKYSFLDFGKKSDESPPPGVDVLSQIPVDMSAYNLVIINDSSSNLLFKIARDGPSWKSLLQDMSSSLQEDSFILILGRKNHHPFERILCTYVGVTLNGVNMSTEKTKEVASSLSLTTIGVKEDSLGFLSILLRKTQSQASRQVTRIETQTETYGWIEQVKDALKDDGRHPVWLIADDSPYNGLIGLINCLRREEGGFRIRCLFSRKKSHSIEDDENNNQVKSATLTNEIVQRNLVVNVVDQDGRMGSYRYTTIPNLDKMTIRNDDEDSYLDVQTKGDLSSLKYFSNSTKNNLRGFQRSKVPREFLVHYASLNFKDVMIASGRIPLSAYPEDMAVCRGSSLGMEFSGVDCQTGEGVMGLVPGNGIASKIILTRNDDDTDDLFIWRISDYQMTLEEAATIPVVYFTVYYALFIRGKIRPRESILIHAGSGGVGQAAIHVCLFLGCTVYTTVGSQEKKSFLLKTFPGLREDHIMNSRDTRFEEGILRLTDGRGVDIILNSLSEDKMQASIRCLGPFGRFLEIGKYDIVENHPFDQYYFDDNQTFHGICVAHLIHDASVNKSPSAINMVNAVKRLMTDGIRDGSVKPIRRDVFDRHQVEDAFRFMASGRHLGKVLIHMRGTTSTTSTTSTMTPWTTMRRTTFDSSKVYIVTGGLGGFGLELSQWLVNCGARKLVITSRTGNVRTSYQKLSLKRIRKLADVVSVVGCPLTTEESTCDLLSKASELGTIGGIFHLAMVLSDALLENQSEDTFRQVCEAKVAATLYLDKLSERMCPKLDYFVCFSSVASGRGNPGQANYGFGNSTMERVCEDRRRRGLHGLAIQWGAIGDVGVVAEVMGGNDVVIGGTVPQRMPSCLDVLDKMLQSSASILSSIVLEDMKKCLSDGKEDLLKVICHVLGVKDPSTLADDTTLGDLGMDSLMAVEIRQGLERDYDMVLSATEVRQLKIGQIKELGEKKKNVTKNPPSGQPSIDIPAS